MVLGNLGNILIFCGEGEKRARGFSPLVLLRGHEEVVQNWSGKTYLRTGEARPHGEDWSGRFARLPQGLGESVSEKQAAKSQIYIDILF